MKRKGKKHEIPVPDQFIIGLNAGIKFRCPVCNKSVLVEEGCCMITPKGVYHAECFGKDPDALLLQLKAALETLKKSEKK